MVLVRIVLIQILVLCCALTASIVAPAMADQKVLVTVNDIPITSFDIDQRISLWKLLGERGGDRKKALNQLIDDIAKVEQAKKYKVEASDKEISERMSGLAKGLKTDEVGLEGKLRAQGISLAAMRQYFAAQIAFSRIVRGKYKEDFSISKADVDRKLAGFKTQINGLVEKRKQEIMKDPRMKPVTAYQILEINFPVDTGGGEMTNELMQSRAIEVNQYVSRFKGCSSARAAASGIFNVQVGKMVEANGAALPAPLKAAFDKTKPGTAIGPIRGPKGLQALGFCGTRRIVPKAPTITGVVYPTRAQAESAAINEKYAEIEAKYSGKFRQGLMIEFRDPSYAQ
jgi:peptidyl-prolyl cis-trans isomerase SurA